MNTKVTEGIISTEAAQKATSMFDDAKNYPGMESVGKVGRKINNKIDTKISSTAYSKINTYVNKASTTSTNSMLSSLKKFF